MGANRDLIKLQAQLSEQEARANVPNFKPLYESTANIAKKGFEMVIGVIDELKREQAADEARKLKYLEPLQKDANGVYKAIYEMEETLPDKVVNALEGEVERMQDDFARFVELAGDDERAINKEYAKMSAQFSKMTNEAKNLRGNLQLMTQDPDTWDVGNIHEDNIDPLRSVFQLVERGALEEIDTMDNITISYVDGKLTWNTKNYSKGTRRVRGPEDSVLGFVNEEYKYGDLRSFNSDQMLEMLPRKDPKHMASKLEQLNGMALLGKNDAISGTYNYNDQMAIGETNKHISDIKTKTDFQNASREQKSEDVIIPALKESLMERVDIPLHVMNNVFVNEQGETIPVGEELFSILNVVKDGDQVLDEKDFKKGMSGKNKEAFKTAYAELIDVYTNIYNPAFNLQSSLVLKGQQDEVYSKQHYDTAYEAEGGKIPGKYYAPKGGEKGANYIINNTNVTAKTWKNTYEPFINKIANLKTDTKFSSPTGKKYKFEKGKYYLQTGVNEYDMDNPMNFNDLAVLDGWDNYVNTEEKKKTAPILKDLEAEKFNKIMSVKGVNVASYLD